jgi:hypothetical protein
MRLALELQQRVELSMTAQPNRVVQPLQILQVVGSPPVDDGEHDFAGNGHKPICADAGFDLVQPPVQKPPRLLPDALE